MELWSIGVLDVIQPEVYKPRFGRYIEITKRLVEVFGQNLLLGAEDQIFKDGVKIRVQRARL